jgi:hypothetical protein
VSDRHRYRVDLARDEPEKLRDVIETLGEEGRKIVSIIWQPERVVTIDSQSRTTLSGYVVVSESDISNADRS